MEVGHFGPVSGSEVSARNSQEGMECGPERPIRAAAEVRRNPKQQAGVGVIMQEKTPTENGWGFNIGGEHGTEPASVIGTRYENGSIVGAHLYEMSILEIRLTNAAPDRTTAITPIHTHSWTP